MTTTTFRNRRTTAIENYFIEGLIEGLMKLDGVLYKDLAGMNYRDLRTLYRCIDDEKLALLIEVGMPIKEALVKLLNGTKLDNTLTEKINAMPEDDVDELLRRIRVLAEVRFILGDEVRNLA